MRCTCTKACCFHPRCAGCVQVEYWYEQQNGQEAYKLIEQMRARGVEVAPYLDHHMVEDIHRVSCGG